VDVDNVRVLDVARSLTKVINVRGDWRSDEHVMALVMPLLAPH
jgi:hypothetical protein